MVYKYWPQHLLSALPARGTGLCYCTPRHGWDEVLSCSDKAMDWLPSLQHCLPGNTILLPALQMLRAFPGGPAQAQKGNYEARPKRKKNTAFRKQVEKRGEGEEGGSISVSAEQPSLSPTTLHTYISFICGL